MRPSFFAICALLLSCAPPAAVTPRCPTTALPNCTAGPDGYSDESCQALEDHERRAGVQTDAMRAPIVVAPMEGEMLPRAAPYTFRWRGQLAARVPASWVRVAERASWAPAWTETLRRSIDLLPSAWAHCAPFTGIGYALTFRSTAGIVARAELSASEFTPDATTWTALQAALPPIELTVLATRFRANAVADGPFGSSVVRRFSLAP